MDGAHPAHRAGPDAGGVDAADDRPRRDRHVAVFDGIDPDDRDAGRIGIVDQRMERRIARVAAVPAMRAATLQGGDGAPSRRHVVAGSRRIVTQKCYRSRAKAATVAAGADMIAEELSCAAI